MGIMRKDLRRGANLSDLEDVAEARGNLLEDSGWILPVLETDITVDAATFKHLGYRKLNGVVYLTFSVAVANPSTHKLLFTLPAGFRLSPTSGIRVYWVLQGGVTLRVDTDGSVRVVNAATVVTGSLSFIADA